MAMSVDGRRKKDIGDGGIGGYVVGHSSAEVTLELG